MDRHELWIVAGPNGAGKTTLVQAAPISQIIPDTTFLNPDDLTREKLGLLGFPDFASAPLDILQRTFIESAEEVYSQVKRAVLSAQAVGVETVLSTDKYRSLVESVVVQSGFFGFIYVALSTPELACRRVAERRRRGGHTVPENKIHERWTRSLTNLSWFASRATVFWVFDNSDERPEVPPQLVAQGRFGRLIQPIAPTFSALHDALLAISPDGSE